MEGGADMSDVDLVQLIVFGFSTGLGTTFGTELAKELIQQIKKRGKNDS
jgi:hypothetical protein